MLLVYEIILLNEILRNHLLSENLQWNYASFNVNLIYLTHNHGILPDIFFGSRQLKAKTLGPIIFHRFTFQDKKCRKLEIYKFIFSTQKIVLWEDMSLLAMNSLYNEKGQWPVPMVRRKGIHAVSWEVFLRESLNYLWFHSVYLVFQYVCFLLPICLPCVIYGTYVTRIKAVSWHIARQTFASLACSLGLFTFGRIACLLQLWIKTSDLDYSIWATPKCKWAADVS